MSFGGEMEATAAASPSNSALVRLKRTFSQKRGSTKVSTSPPASDGSSSSSAAMASLDTAIRLVTQAVAQDTAKNYEEAARCYREAVVLFRTVSKSKGISKRVQKAIEDKTVLYEARLKKLDRHLLGKADLTKLFREVVSAYSKKEDEEAAGGVERPTSSASASDSNNSVDTEVLYENPFLKKGLDTIAKAKREDARSHLSEAIHFYEQGAGHLLDAVRKGRVGERQADIIRIKCLLIHDRCELIRNHLEYGAPLKVRKESLDSFETSLEGSPESGGSPVPLFEEDRVLLMEEVRSQASASVAGSTHSLYPLCVEIKRSPSTMSGYSDFNVTVLPANKALAAAPPHHHERHQQQQQQQQEDGGASVPIPLANLDAELNLSAMSINSRISRQTAASVSASVAAVALSNRSQSNSLEELAAPHIQHVVEVEQHPAPEEVINSSSSSSSSHPQHDDILVVDENGRLTDLSCSTFSLEERDRNVTELTLMNSGIDSDLYKQYLHGQQQQQQQQQADEAGGSGSPQQHQQQHGDSGSDSGFSDPSQDTVQSKSPALSESRKSHLSDIDSLDIVPSLPLSNSPAPSAKSSSLSPSPRTPRTPTLLIRRQRSRGSSGASVRVSDEDDLQVLSEETVVNGRLLMLEEPAAEVRPEVYTKARPRDEYIPPRAYARRVSHRAHDAEDSSVNKGCYYFMACLDSFWIL